MRSSPLSSALICVSFSGAPPPPPFRATKVPRLASASVGTPACWTATPSHSTPPPPTPLVAFCTPPPLPPTVHDANTRSLPTAAVVSGPNIIHNHAGTVRNQSAPSSPPMAGITGPSRGATSRPDAPLVPDQPSNHDRSASTTSSVASGPAQPTGRSTTSPNKRHDGVFAPPTTVPPGSVAGHGGDLIGTWAPARWPTTRLPAGAGPHGPSTPAEDVSRGHLGPFFVVFSRVLDASRSGSLDARPPCPGSMDSAMAADLCRDKEEARTKSHRGSRPWLRRSPCARRELS